MQDYKANYQGLEPKDFIRIHKQELASIADCIEDMATGKGGWDWEQVVTELREASLHGFTPTRTITY